MKRQLILVLNRLNIHECYVSGSVVYGRSNRKNSFCQGKSYNKIPKRGFQIKTNVQNLLEGFLAFAQFWEVTSMKRYSGEVRMMALRFGWRVSMIDNFTFREVFFSCDSSGARLVEKFTYF